MINRIAQLPIKIYITELPAKEQNNREVKSVPFINIVCTVWTLRKKNNRVKECTCSLKTKIVHLNLTPVIYS